MSNSQHHRSAYYRSVGSPSRATSSSIAHSNLTGIPSHSSTQSYWMSPPTWAPLGSFQPHAQPAHAHLQSQPQPPPPAGFWGQFQPPPMVEAHQSTQAVTPTEDKPKPEPKWGPKLKNFADELGIKVSYEDSQLNTGHGHMWIVKCFLDGIEISGREGSSKKETKRLVAKDAYHYLSREYPRHY